MTTRIVFALAAALAASSAMAGERTVLQTLPASVQKSINETRARCPAENVTSGDEGLSMFTVSGADAILIDELNLCTGGCMHGINCATGYSHTVNIYIRSGSGWKKAFSVFATEPIFLS